MNTEYQNFLISNFGFAQDYADNCRNFKYITKSEVDLNDIEFFNNDRLKAEHFDFFIIRVLNVDVLISKFWIFKVHLKDPKKYNWKDFGFFVQEFNQLLGD